MFRRVAGFTLVEIMITVTVIGLLASMSIVSFQTIRERTLATRFLNDSRELGHQFQLYAIENGEFPAGADAGVLPEGMEEYISESIWNTPSPFGGHWQWVHESAGVRAAIVAVGINISAKQLQRFEERYDDGDMRAGTYRQLSESQYGRVLETEP